MRLALRLLAEVKPGTGKFLESGAPTGLTGLYTHPSPRSTLLYLYSATLEKLKQFPDHSVYRQSAEALTKQRQKVIEQIKPAGYDEWLERAKNTIEEHPGAFQGSQSTLSILKSGTHTFVTSKSQGAQEEQEWDGEKMAPTLEGTRNEKEGAWNAKMMQRNTPETQETVEWEPEPPLTATQYDPLDEKRSPRLTQCRIDEAEQTIGAGLIEEVIQVAEGELKLADTLLESKVYASLLSLGLTSFTS